MIIRFAERDLKTKFGNYSEILYYDGQLESIAPVNGEHKGKSGDGQFLKRETCVRT